jgi:hypothetical protein
LQPRFGVVVVVNECLSFKRWCYFLHTSCVVTSSDSNADKLLNMEEDRLSRFGRSD